MIGPVARESRGGSVRRARVGPRSGLWTLAHDILRSPWVMGISVILACFMIPACTGKGEGSRSDNRVPGKETLIVLPKLPAAIAGLSLDTVDKPRRFSEDDIWEYLDGGGHEIIRLGFEHLIVACYREPANDRKVLVEAYYMKSPEAAGSLLDAWRSKSAKASNICGRGFEDGPLVSWQKGTAYVRLIATFDDDTTQTVLDRIGRGLCAVLSPR